MDGNFENLKAKLNALRAQLEQIAHARATVAASASSMEG